MASFMFVLWILSLSCLLLVSLIEANCVRRNCSVLSWSGPLWGYSDATGILLEPYTPRLQWIGTYSCTLNLPMMLFVFRIFCDQAALAMDVQRVPFTAPNRTLRLHLDQRLVRAPCSNL